MSLPRSPPPAQVAGAASLMSLPPSPSTASCSDQVCPICSEKMDEKIPCMLISKCAHIFHRACIENTLASQSECPVCHSNCELADLKKVNFPIKPVPKSKPRPRGGHIRQYQTRSTNRNPSNEPLSLDISVHEGQTLGNSPEQNRTGNPAVTAQHNIPNFEEINKMIENNLTRILQNLNIIPNNSWENRVPNPVNIQRQNREGSQNLHNNSPNNRFSTQPLYANDNSNLSNSQLSTLRSDKITSMIQSWGLKFDGSSNGLNVEEFLYRLRILTNENFAGDFNLICKHLHILLSGKARDWYWRYHKTVSFINWGEFCTALRCQYRDCKSNFDIKEEIRNRKQKPGETFDMFYEAVSSIMDRLQIPLSDSELIEILTRNLRPDIRHELLYVNIDSIPHLRQLVQMRETFLNDDYIRRNLNMRNTPVLTNRRQVSELDNEPNLNIKDQVDAVGKADNPPRCWNCDCHGHFWEDCLAERKIFCYGCGAKNTYKPQCQRCQTRKSKNSNFQSLPREQT